MPHFEPALIRQGAFDRSRRLARVRQLCEDHLDEKITLARAASVAGLEYSYFSSFFHNAVGVPFGDWLRYIRVRKARGLIRDSAEPIGHIAQRCGFNNLRTFQRAFRRVTGKTPRQFRSESRQVSRAAAVQGGGQDARLRALAEGER